MTRATITEELELELAERWKSADHDLDSARRAVEIATGTLWRIVPRWLGDPAEWVGRWARETVVELDELDAARELPGGGR
jgi:hypothetical protein